MPEVIAGKLRQGLPVTDPEFDRLLPEWARRPSRVHWTPVEVARVASALLVSRPGMHVLDVGAGAGKFCIVAALTSAAVFYGVEQRAPLVACARGLAGRLGARNVKLVHGNMMGLRWEMFDGFYLYNPFVENVREFSPRIDDDLSLEPRLFDRYVAFVEAKLELARIGTRVVTFHGFGGDFPPEYCLEKVVPVDVDRLELWVKAR